MNLNKNLLAISILSMSLNANAALTSYTGAGGVGLVYSSVSNVTWTKDADLLMTILGSGTSPSYWWDYGLSDMFASVITNTPNAYDTPPFSGIHSVTSADFYGVGYVSWYGAKAFVNYLNSINYGGSNQWRLPKSNSIVGFDGTNGNELGQLFYSELGGAPGTMIPNTDVFINEQEEVYWLDTEFELNPDQAWIFGIVDGHQYHERKWAPYYVWPVSPGRVPAVPLPAASWFMLTGLFGYFGLKRFKKQSLVQ